jgi:dolichol-phosphate mannosyltransferase
LDLLLKSPLPADGTTEIPFSFGTRKEGESKLTGKVMLRYLEQLGELYRWKYGELIFVVVTMAFVIGLAYVTKQMFYD